MDWGKLIVSLFDTSKLAGWVRAGVAAILGVVATKWLGGTVFKDVLSPEVITTISVAIAGLVVGLWSQLAKKLDPDYKEPPTT